MPQPEPLVVVRFLFRNKPELSSLTHVAATVSVFLDASVELPLHKACKLESLPLLNRIWASTVDVEPGQDPSWSVRNLLRTEKPHYLHYQFSKCLLEAINVQSLSLVKWLFEHFPNIPVRQELVASAAGAGAFDILKYFYANETTFEETAEWPRDVEWGGFDALEAAKSGHSDIVKWLYKEVEEDRDDDKMMYYAVASGDVELVRWLQKEKEISPSCGFHHAAAKGCFEVIRSFLREHTNGTGVLLKAAEHGHLSIVRWVIDRNLEDDDSSSDSEEEVGGGLMYGADDLPFHITALGGEASLSIHVAAVNGHLEVAQYLQEQVDSAVRESDRIKENRRRVRMLRKLSVYVGSSHQAQPISSETMLHAAKRGLLEVVKWLYSEFGADRRINLFDEGTHRENETFAATLAMDAAAMNGHLDVVKYLHQVAPTHETEVSRARKRRKTGLENMNVFIGGKRFQHASIKCTAEAMDGAAANNHLEVVKWLHDNRTEGCTPLGMALAAASGHVEMMEWLHSNCNIGTTGAMDAAVINGRLDALKWLHKHTSSTCSTDAMDIAAFNGHFAVVQWLHEHTSAGCTTDAMDNAAGRGHLDIVKWLHHNRTEGCTSDAMDHAALSGALETVKWLGENRAEGCTTDAMDVAAKNGHLDVIKWLHHNQSQGCTAKAMLSAAATRNWQVMKWLHKHRAGNCTSSAIDQAALVCDFEAVLFLHRVRQENVSAEMVWRNEVQTCPGLGDWSSKMLSLGFELDTIAA
ncbi:hypothetical protein PF007_g11552 [Phytophthora fragariae]|uniref:Uncharacterized protein n=2 Tax=Phytophthora fragariae TaxID=53985 RepID=A0A6A3S7E1_9STRA|nr:hypothetical protein PF007_g11552 [Phytophthora fragariae]